MASHVRKGTRVTLLLVSTVAFVLPMKTVHFIACVRKVILGTCVMKREDLVIQYLASMVEPALKAIISCLNVTVQ